MEDGEVVAEEGRFLLHYVLLQQGGDLVAEEGLVVLPDLPLHLDCTDLIKLLVSHHHLQLLLWHLWKGNTAWLGSYDANSELAIHSLEFY